MTPREELEGFEEATGGYWALWDAWRAAYDSNDQVARDIAAWRLRRMKKLRVAAEAYETGRAVAMPLQTAVEFVAGLQLADRYKMHEADAEALETVVEIARRLG